MSTEMLDALIAPDLGALDSATKPFVWDIQPKVQIAELAKIAEEFKAKRPVAPVTVRTFLSWFGAQRRGYDIVARIKKQLKEAGLVTFPDFESQWIDTPIGFLIAGSDGALPSGADEVEASAVTTPVDVVQASNPSVRSRVNRDPTYRVSKLQAANQKIVSVKPDDTIAQVVTRMMGGAFSQLPVMTSDRDVKGMITCKSVAFKMALGTAGKTARDFMERHHEIRSDTSIFSAIPLIVTHDYVLVRDNKNIITGIITSADLSKQFLMLTEPFLLLSEIENIIRNMIEDRFLPNELACARESSSTGRAIESVANMNFGEYIQLLQNPDRWAQLGTSVDRTIFCESLDRVRKIRNNVAHFDPDGITDQDLERLRHFAGFLKQLEFFSTHL